MKTLSDDRIRGGLYGLLVGDALGVPYEFHDPRDLPPLDAIEMEPPAGFRRAHRGTPPGTWSDDGSQALALLDSLLSCGRLDPEDLGRRFLRWWNEGYATPDGRPFDIGNQTRDALARLERGVPALEAGGRGERDNGNGSLMRVLPLALWHRGDDASLIQAAHDQSRVTHGHPRSQAACALYVLWARGELQGYPEPFERAVDLLRAFYGDSEHGSELDLHILPSREPTGTGYVVDCLHSARWALQADDYTTVVRRAVSLGLDTDTTAAVAGGIAGIRFGLGGIPERWLDSLQGRSFVDGLLSRVLAPKVA